MNREYIVIIIVVILFLSVLMLVYKSGELRREFESELSKALNESSGQKGSILAEEDMKQLPEPVKKYLFYTGAVGKEKVRNFRILFQGEFKTGPDKDWTGMHAVQYSEIQDVKRLYYMDMKMAGLPIVGLHKYIGQKAIMLIKLAGLITVGDGKGEEMNKGETVTVFNDMCMFAPGSLIDKRIQWETIDPLTVRGTFDNNGIKVSAMLYFNDKGELVNFISDDRYYSPTGKTYQNVRWSTPSQEYKEYNGYRLSSGGQAVWSFTEGDYCYARVDVKEVEYNINE